MDLLRGVELGVVDNNNEHKKLVRLLRQRIPDQTCVIDSDVSMGEAAKTSLISGGLQKLDIILFKNINDLRHPVVLIEVESNSSVFNTVNKLANGIMCQIIHLRNTGHATNTLKRFFIPVRDGNAEEITVIFDDNRLQFNCNRIPVTQAEIIPVIIEAWNNQKHILQLQRMGLTFPIFSDRITQKFDRYAHQVKSGLFVVIHNPIVVITNTLSWTMRFSLTY